MTLRSICKNAIDGNSFVGIKYIEGKPEIHFPMSYNIPNENHECQKSIFSLFRTIYISNHYSKESLNGNFINPRNEMPIYSYLWLINDYLSNGLYSNRDIVYKKNENGKINWKKTLKSNPLFTDNGAVFINTVTSKHIDINDIISRIQIRCLNIANQTIGFIYGNISVPKDEVMFSNDYLISILRKEQIKTFVDRKKHLVNELINILSDSTYDIEVNRIRTYGTYNFEIVWEQIIDRMFGNISDVSRFYPGTYYILEEPSGYNRVNNSRLRPDTIMDVEQRHFILDAKYYSFQNKQNLPSSSDIQKQITYADYMEKVLADGQEIYNAFIVPYDFNNQETESARIKYIGYGEAEWRNGQKKTHDKISLILLDTRFALDCFSKYQGKVNIDELANEIVKSHS
jgi:hypothetical protein